jgi:hypothetical protein
MNPNCVQFLLLKRISGAFFNLATGHFSGKIFIEGHSSCHTDYNDIGLEFILCQGVEKKEGQTHTHTNFRYYHMDFISELNFDFLSYAN